MPWLLAAATAMRQGELLRLKWSDVNWVARTLVIPETKNGERRTIPVSTVALCLLQQLQSENRSTEPRVFPISARAVKLAWRRATTRAGIVDLNFHDLRHEAISRFFELGLCLPEVALISGHRDPRMSMRYTHLGPAELAQKLSHQMASQPIQMSTMPGGEAQLSTRGLLALSACQKTARPTRPAVRRSQRRGLDTARTRYRRAPGR